MRPREPEPGTFLQNNSDGLTGLVVAYDWTRPFALTEALIGWYGGAFTSNNPVIIEAADELKVRRWRYCTSKFREFEGLDSEVAPSWWAPHGDGKSWIWVLELDDVDVFALGDKAAEAQERMEARS